MSQSADPTADAGALRLPPSAHLLVSDVDNTLTGDDTAMSALADLFAAHGQRLVLAMNSSRPVASVRRSLAAIPRLPQPMFIIGAMGTEIEQREPAGALEAYAQHLRSHWDREVVHRTALQHGLVPHDEEFQTPLKASYDCRDAAIVARLGRALEQQGVPSRVIYSSGKDLDLLPPNAGKSAAIHWLIDHLGLPADRVLVSGDSENDLDMFDPAFRGIVVGNATPGLLAQAGSHAYRAKAHHAAGVLEGLHHYGVLPEGVRW